MDLEYPLMIPLMSGHNYNTKYNDWLESYLVGGTEDMSNDDLVKKYFLRDFGYKIQVYNYQINPGSTSEDHCASIDYLIFQNVEEHSAFILMWGDTALNNAT